MSDQKNFTKIDESIWGVQDILETDQEMIEFEKNYPSDELPEVSLLNEADEILPSKMNSGYTFAQCDDFDDDEIGESEDYFDDRGSNDDTYQDGVYYLI